MVDYKISFLLITLVTISMIITGTTIFMSDVVTTYGISGAQNYSSLSKLDDITDSTESMSSLLQNTTSDPGIIDYAKAWATGGWNALTITFDSTRIAGEMATETVSEMPVEMQGGLLSWFLPGLMAILAILLTVAILGLIFRKDV